MSVPSQPNEYPNSVGGPGNRPTGPAVGSDRPGTASAVSTSDKNEIPTKWFYICYNTRPNDRPLAFEGCDLRGLEQWTDLYLQWSVLERSDLRNLTLTRCDLEGANLCSVDLRGANLQNVNLKNAILDGANLSHAQLQGVSLHNASLKGVQAEDCRMINVDMRNANLSGASVNQSKLEEVNMTDVTCDSAAFRFSKLMWVTFNEHCFDKADMRGAEIRRKVTENSEDSVAHKQDPAVAGQERRFSGNGTTLQEREIIKSMGGTDAHHGAGQGTPSRPSGPPTSYANSVEGRRSDRGLLEEPQYGRPGLSPGHDPTFGPPSKRPYEGESWNPSAAGGLPSGGPLHQPYHTERPPPVLGDRPRGGVDRLVLHPDRPVHLDRPVVGDMPSHASERPVGPGDHPGMPGERPLLPPPERQMMRDGPAMHENRHMFEAHLQDNVRPPLLGGSPGGPNAVRPGLRPPGPGTGMSGGLSPGGPVGMTGPGHGNPPGPGNYSGGPGVPGMRPGFHGHRMQRPPRPDGPPIHPGLGPRIDGPLHVGPFGPRSLM